jgi:hypothetical protein
MIFVFWASNIDVFLRRKEIRFGKKVGRDDSVFLPYDFLV